MNYLVVDGAKGYEKGESLQWIGRGKQILHDWQLW